jgi:hypothetical protein
LEAFGALLRTQVAQGAKKTPSKKHQKQAPEKVPKSIKNELQNDPEYFTN